MKKIRDLKNLFSKDREGNEIRWEQATGSYLYTYTDKEKNEYVLTVMPYETERYFGKRQAILYKNGREIAEFWRNYSDFPYCFVEHSNGNLYFICSEHYHGEATIYNITTGEKRVIHPTDNMNPKPEYLSCFMWITIKYNPDHEELDVYGGYWGCEADFGTRTFDFSRPEEVPYDDNWWHGIRTTEGQECDWDDDDDEEDE